MFDRVTVRAADRKASERFYRLVLGMLGIEPSHTDSAAIAWDDFAIVDADPDPTRHLHIGFVAPSREHVDAFWRAGVDAGYEDDGEPGERPHYTPGYYGAFLRDPDGNSAEAVHHGGTRAGGHIDHLWIRVDDLDAAEAFFNRIARYTGLRHGERDESHRQFVGAWATFMLVDDEQPATEHLQLAFPAPDRATVDAFHEAAAGVRAPGGVIVESVARR